MITTLNTALRNRQADSVGSDLDLGFIHIYDGVRPSDPDDAPAGTLLVTLELNADAYGAANGGTALVAGIVSGTVVADGTAVYAQQVNAGGTRWMYGDVSLLGGDGEVQIDAVDLDLQIGDVITLTSGSITQGGSTVSEQDGSFILLQD